LNPKELVFLREKATLNLAYNLTPLQKSASQFLTKKFNDGKDSLLVAVCGAGKTEIIYDVIIEALKQRKNICVAIPRVEVVKEIAERINQDLKIKVSRLYGGSSDEQKATLFVSTCNQLMKYPNYFDLIIIDEADAFPYAVSNHLKYGLRNALKRSGTIIKMTATPSLHDRWMIKNKFVIRARYHRQKIVVPSVIISNKPIDQVKKRMMFMTPLIIYVPSINYLNKVKEEFGDDYLYISSRTENKDEIINSFKKGVHDVMFSTTILERGLTFKGLNVVVINSESKIFTISTLIQIAGRVGRKYDSPSGKIIFLSRERRIKLLVVIFKIMVDNFLSRLRGDIH
jgi:competence protein ComFA